MLACDTHTGASVPCESGGDAGLGRWPGAARGWGTLVLPSSEGGGEGGLGAAQGQMSQAKPPALQGPSVLWHQTGSRLLLKEAYNVPVQIK